MDKNTNKEFIKAEGKLTIDDKITIKELEEKIVSMKKDKEKKCKFAKEQLVEQLKIDVEKWRTATGTAEALRTLRFVVGSNEVDLTWANRLAWDMAVETDRMREKSESLTYAEMDKLCDGFYEKEFKFDVSGESKIDLKEYQLAFELMRLDLCQGVGKAAEDMVEFIKRAEEEIDATGKKLKELIQKKAEEVK